MNTTMPQTTRRFSRHPLLRFLLVLLAFAGGAPAARAGLTVDVHLYSQNSSYFAYGYLSTNSNSPPPAGAISISSPQGVNQGTTIYYTCDGATLSWGGGGGWSLSDVASFMAWLTNGTWTIGITNGPNTNLLYTFTVSAPDISASEFAAVVITFPNNGAVYVPNEPDFAWQGPIGWEGSINVNDWTNDSSGNGYYQAGATLSGSETNWASSTLLPYGTNTFNVNYTSNATPFIVASTPLETNSHAALPDWVSTATMESDASSTFSIGTAPATGGSAGSGGHTNIAHYAFDSPVLNTNFPASLGLDSSPYNNSFGGFSTWGPVFQPTTNAVAGGQAVQFFGASCISEMGGMSDPTFSNLVTALSGSFTVSCWVNTTNLVGANNSDPFSGMTILWDYFQGIDDAVPIAVTGTKAAFFTSDASGAGDTLHSGADVVTGSYVHVAVTRNQIDGTKRIYINGSLDQSDVASTDTLNADTNFISIGGAIGSSYIGLLDDLQIYTGVLDTNEIAFIYNNPGVTVPDKVATPPGANIVAHYTFDNVSNLGADSSGNGYDLNYNGNPQGNGVVFSATAEAGGGAASFDGGSFFSYTTTPPAVLNALAGDFTISLWVNTTQTFGNDGDYAYDGAGLVTADVPGVTNDVVPIALTGGGIGFNTGGTSDDTLSSTNDINDGSYHHVAVTRNQATGEKQIYIDGQLNNSDVAATNYLNAQQIIAIGAQIDASQSDPSIANTFGYYQGLIDDIQIYSNTLTSAQIAYLYNNPGVTLSPSNTAAPLPVSVSLELNIYRNHDPVAGDTYTAYPWFESFSPALITSNTVQSPDGYFQGASDSSGGGASSYGLTSLDDVIHECTNGLWTLYINQGDPSQQKFTFSVSVTGLTTNLLTPVEILVPTNGAMAVAPNTPIQWIGPADFSSLSVSKQNADGSDNVGASLPVAATSWPSPPPLDFGTNQVYITYVSNGFPGVTFTTPANASMNPMASWSTTVDLYSTATSQFIIGPTVTLTNLLRNGTNFQFSYLSLSNFTASVQSTTNLASTNWTPYTNITGDGTLKTVQVPATNKAQFFRISFY
jgi:hypothetical protein